MPKSDAVLLIAFGGPASAAEIRQFLERVTKGIPIPPERLEEVARHYEAVGGKSPINEITFRQADRLRALLAARNLPLPVYVGLRHASPFFTEALEQMANDGVETALGLILSPHQTEASWERYQKNVTDADARLGARAPQVHYCEGWHDHPLFIETWSELIAACFAKISPAQRAVTPLIFTAHSVPVAMASRSPYVGQVATTARLVARSLGHHCWSIAYQSRSGKPTDAWLEPDIKEAIGALAAEDSAQVVVAPIGFVCDHVEVLYDLDIEARSLAAGRGLEMLRAGCPNDSPVFIRMMAAVVEATLAGRSPANP